MTGKASFQKAILGWYVSNSRSFPWRETDDAYRIAIAEIMLRQTFAEKVVPVYRAFLQVYPNVSTLSQADPEEIRRLIRPLGLLYRAGQMVTLAKSVVGQHRGRFPDNRKALEALPGIGPYTASAILCFSCGQPEAIIDTNVLRVYRRFFGLGPHSTQRGPDKRTIEVARDMLPSGREAHDYNLALLDFAALVCTHYSPKCEQCILSSDCVFVSTPMED